MVCAFSYAITNIIVAPETAVRHARKRGQKRVGGRGRFRDEGLLLPGL